MRPAGLIAILRGITPTEVTAVGKVLVDEGFTSIEVPLNSPQPFESISILRQELPKHVAVGAGTVLFPEDVSKTKAAGGNIIVSPDTNPLVIEKTIVEGLCPYPGVATATEAFAAIRAGAKNLKIFPATETSLTQAIAWKAVLPADVQIIPVGGVGPDNFIPWVKAGATGAGIGTALYRPGYSPQEVRLRAKQIMTAWTEATKATISQ